MKETFFKQSLKHVNRSHLPIEPLNFVTCNTVSFAQSESPHSAVASAQRSLLPLARARARGMSRGMYFLHATANTAPTTRIEREREREVGSTGTR